MTLSELQSSEIILGILGGFALFFLERYLRGRAHSMSEKVG
jgi:hypothetical protein